MFSAPAVGGTAGARRVFRSGVVAPEKATPEEILAEASTRVLTRIEGPILFSAPHGIELLRVGCKNHAMERHTTEIARLLAELCVVDGEAASYVVWNVKACRPAQVVVRSSPTGVQPSLLRFARAFSAETTTPRGSSLPAVLSRGRRRVCFCIPSLEPLNDDSPIACLD